MISKNKPFISVVIPVYKTEKYIKNTAQSLVNQTFKLFEVILVDDQTPDDAIKIAENVFIENSIDFITISQKNSGLGMSKNNGVKHAKGEWIMFLDSDDTLQPDTFEMMRSIALNNCDVNFIYSDFQRVTVGNEFKKAQLDKGVVFFDKFDMQNKFLLRSEIINSPGTLYNKEWYIDNKLLFTKIPYSMDQLFVWKKLLKSDKIAKIRKPLYNYLQRPGSIMSASNYSAIIKGYPEFKNLQKKYIDSSESTELAKKYLLSRWVMGALHSGAKLINKDEYIELFENLEAREHSINMLKFPSAKMKTVALMLLSLPNMSYWILKRV